MHATTMVYNNIVSAGLYSVQTKIYDVDNSTYLYSDDDIVSCSVESELFPSIGIGYVVSKVLKLNVYGTETDLVGKTVRVDTNIVDENGTPYQLIIHKGTFKIDSASASPQGDENYIEIVGYDALTQSDVPYMTSGTFSGSTAYEIVSSICTTLGVTMESSTYQLLYSRQYAIPFIPIIGTNGTTLRQMLSFIACMYGGNFIINESNELKFIDAYTNTGGGSLIPETFYGDDYKRETAPSIDKLVAWLSDSEYLKYPSDETEFNEREGYLLSFNCPYMVQSMLDELGENFEEHEYSEPFSANGIFLDPKYELGDHVIFEDLDGTIHNHNIGCMVAYCNPLYRADVSFGVGSYNTLYEQTDMTKKLTSAATISNTLNNAPEEYRINSDAINYKYSSYDDAITKTSGANIFEQKVVVCGGWVNVTLCVKKTSSTSSGSNIFEGTIYSAFAPERTQMSSSYYSTSAIGALIKPDGTVIVRAIDSVTISNGAYLSWSYPLYIA